MLRIATYPTRFQRATNLDRQRFRLQSLSMPALRGIANACIAAAVRGENTPVLDWRTLVCSRCKGLGCRGHGYAHHSAPQRCRTRWSTRRRRQGFRGRRHYTLVAMETTDEAGPLYAWSVTMPSPGAIRPSLAASVIERAGSRRGDEPAYFDRIWLVASTPLRLEGEHG